MVILLLDLFLLRELLDYFRSSGYVFSNSLGYRIGLGERVLEDVKDELWVFGKSDSMVRSSRYIGFWGTNHLSDFVAEWFRKLNCIE